MDTKNAAEIYANECVTILKEIVRFADENGEDRYDAFHTIVGMLNGTKNDVTQEMINAIGG